MIPMIVLGIVLIIIGAWLDPVTSLGLNLLELLGAILLIFGVVFFIAWATGHPIGHRRHWWL